jgi:uncharacterized membrane protein
MFQTVLGFAVLLVGLVGVTFSERLASSHRAFTQWAFGFDPYFGPDGGRAGFILLALAISIMGLLIAMHVVPAD